MKCLIDMLDPVNSWMLDKRIKTQICQIDTVVLLLQLKTELAKQLYNKGNYENKSVDVLHA